ncbi:MAG: peptidylprolyl isomerase [Pseudomonas sp.]|uniref:peptidylprolyl isomerase n=1 Tax=Pseudomonas sp. TaxID=306 RepID=UPI003BB49C8E
MAKAMARHILVKTEAEAASLKARIAKGEAFDVLAKKHSICPSGKRGGDLGEVRPGQMVHVIDQVIFKKTVREIHGPVRSSFGYHLVQVFYRD